MWRFLLFCLFVAYVGLYAFLYSVRFWGPEVLIGYSQHPSICTFYTFQPWWAPLCTLKPNTPGHEGITISSKDGKIWPSLEDVFMGSFPNSNNTVSPSTAQKVFTENQVQWLSNQTFFYGYFETRHLKANGLGRPNSTCLYQQQPNKTPSSRDSCFNRRTTRHHLSFSRRSGPTRSDCPTIR